MKRSLKTKEIVNAYQLLGNAKYHKLDDTDKIKVWMLSRKIKPIATQAMEDKQDANDRLLPEDFQEKWAKAIEYEKGIKEGVNNLPMTDKEYREFVIEFKRCNDLVGKAIEELFSKEIEIEFEPLSEEAMGLLVVSNDWTFNEAEKLEWMME